ncbi:MAG: SOS response-associated peptidase [FCB group bacterium]|nr:SOS response-associated peptidase [FCB group bacterium]
MCGRKTLTKGKRRILEELSVEKWESDFNWEPSYNIAPTQSVPVLTFDGARKIGLMRWGLIPNWAKDLKIGARMINARAETLTEKPSYRNLLSRNRCVVICDGYFEWQQTAAAKTPFYIHFPDRSIMPLAGLWDRWRADGGKIIDSYTVITTTPGNLLRPIHNRMPAILPADAIDKWIDTQHFSAESALSLLVPFSGAIDYYEVSSYVNSPANNSPKCIEGI